MKVRRVALTVERTSVIRTTLASRRSPKLQMLVTTIVGATTLVNDVSMRRRVYGTTLPMGGTFL